MSDTDTAPPVSELHEQTPSGQYVVPPIQTQVQANAAADHRAATAAITLIRQPWMRRFASWVGGIIILASAAWLAHCDIKTSSSDDAAGISKEIHELRTENSKELGSLRTEVLGLMKEIEKSVQQVDRQAITHASRIDALHQRVDRLDRNMEKVEKDVGRAVQYTRYGKVLERFEEP